MCSTDRIGTGAALLLRLVHWDVGSKHMEAHFYVNSKNIKLKNRECNHGCQGVVGWRKWGDAGERV